MKLRLIVLAAAAAALLLASPAAPAIAAEDEPQEVCTVGGIAVAVGETPPAEIPVVISCFDNEADAKEFIESGAPGDLERLLEVPPHNVDSGAQPRILAAASTVIIGKVWTGTSRGGSELIHWGTGSGCYGVTYGFPTLPVGWNNNIRSAEGYSNCWASHYGGTSYSGSVLTCAPYCATLGFLDAQSSSIVYRPVGTFG